MTTAMIIGFLLLMGDISKGREIVLKLLCDCFLCLAARNWIDKSKIKKKDNAVTVSQKNEL